MGCAPTKSVATSSPREIKVAGATRTAAKRDTSSSSSDTSGTKQHHSPVRPSRPTPPPPTTPTTPVQQFEPSNPRRSPQDAQPAPPETYTQPKVRNHHHPQDEDIHEVEEDCESQTLHVTSCDQTVLEPAPLIAMSPPPQRKSHLEMTASEGDSQGTLLGTYVLTDEDPNSFRIVVETPDTNGNHKNPNPRGLPPLHPDHRKQRISLTSTAPSVSSMGPRHSLDSDDTGGVSIIETLSSRSNSLPRSQLEELARRHRLCNSNHSAHHNNTDFMATEEIDRIAFSRLIPNASALFKGRFFDVFDLNGDGKITLEEYLTAATVLSEPGITQDKIDLTFRLWDINGDGHVTQHELAQIVISASEGDGLIISPEQALELVRGSFEGKEEITIKDYASMVIQCPRILDMWHCSLGVFANCQSSTGEPTPRDMM
eukprot:PhF_6_TR42801/c0_g1_i2/m.64790